MAKTPANDLNEMFLRSENALQSHFAEIRTNILLDTGFHHPRSDRIGSSRIFKDIPKQKRIRITKNHIQVITKYIRNSIQNRAPDGGIYPRNEKECSDQKAAELNQSVYEHLKTESELSSVYSQLIHDFVVQGETHTKVFHDPTGGRFIGYEDGPEPDEDDEDDGDGDEENPKVRRMDKRKPKFKGKICFERIPAYNFLTDPDADSERTCGWVAIRKFFPRKKLIQRYLGDKEKVEIIEKSGRDKKGWFNGFTGVYSDNEGDEVEIREFFWKPCHEWPEGRYVYCTDLGDDGILEEGTLPDGFCIFSAVYDESPENPRGYSVIKTVKPYQTEINRAAAAAITESIVLGHSTVMYPAGEKPSTTGIGNGLKGLAYHSVNPPTIIPGQTGQNYHDYLESQVREMYAVALVPQQDEEKAQGGGNDGNAMLGRALRDKMRFSLYAEKVEHLICRMIDYSLKLARRYLPDDELILMVGKTEAVNIPEFKNTTPQQYQIKIEPRSDDFTNVYGKSLQIIQSLQYVGNQLPPQAIAGMIRELPFLNNSAMLRDYTVMQDLADSQILSLDRGEIPFKFPDADHAYLCQRLQMRMNESDFPTLSPEVQLNYQDRYDWHIQMRTQQEQDAAAATAGYLPSGGGMVSCDVYVQTPEGKQQRAKVPYEAMMWLIERLKQQGTDVSKITNQPLADQAALGRSNLQAGVDINSQGPMPTPGPQSMPMTGS